MDNQCEGRGNRFQQPQLMRSGEHELPIGSIIIHDPLDVTQQMGGTLNLIENGPAAMTLKEALRVFQAYIIVIRQDLPNQGGLPCLTRPSTVTTEIFFSCVTNSCSMDLEIINKKPIR